MDFDTTSKVHRLTKEEELIRSAIIHGREVQEYLWGELSLTKRPEFDLDKWSKVFQKRVDKIYQIDPSHPNHKVELKKRILQQAALSIAALSLLQTLEKNDD